MPRILVVEDDRRISFEVSEALRAAGYEVVTAETESEARHSLADGCELILLDLGLPDGEGLDLCEELRRNGNDVPILVLTARDAPDDRVVGLQAGADDYVTKPFHIPELVARTGSLLRRATGQLRSSRIEIGDLWIEPVARSAGRGTKQFKLKPREFDLLLFLARNPHRTWTRKQLIQHVWGPDFDGNDRTVDLHVGRVRCEIEVNPHDPRYVVTVWGTGYVFRSGR